MFNYKVIYSTGGYISAMLTGHLLSYSDVLASITCCGISFLLLVG